MSGGPPSNQPWFYGTGLPSHPNYEVSITGASDPSATFGGADARSSTLPPLDVARAAPQVFSERLQRQQAVAMTSPSATHCKQEAQEGMFRMPSGAPSSGFSQSMMDRDSIGFGAIPTIPQWNSAANSLRAQSNTPGFTPPSNHWQLAPDRWQPTRSINVEPLYQPHQSSFAHLQSPLPLPQGMSNVGQTLAPNAIPATFVQPIQNVARQRT